MEKRDLRVERTYYMLHEAFTRLMEQKTFEKITVNELCDEAMIRRTTFYKHFADKFDYLAHYLEEVKESFRNQLEPDIMTKQPSAYFVSMSRELFHFMRAHEKLVRNCHKSNMFNMLCDMLAQQIQNDLLQTIPEEPGGDSTVDRRAMAAFYAGGLMNGIRWWITNRSLDEPDAFAACVVQIIQGWQLDSDGTEEDAGE